MIAEYSFFDPIEIMQLNFVRMHLCQYASLEKFGDAFINIVCEKENLLGALKPFLIHSLFHT